MKKLLLLFCILLAGFAARAQSCELRNNSGENIVVKLIALRGGIIYMTDPFPLSASTSMGPFVVATTSWPWASSVTPPAGAYLIAIHVEVPGCGDVFDVDNSNPIYTSCMGQPSQFQTSYDDIGNGDIILHNN